MKPFTLLFAALITLLAACTNKEKAMSDSERDAKIDSLVMARTEDINKRAMDDLEKRMATEVRGKADSMVKARMAGDTTKH